MPTPTSSIEFYDNKRRIGECSHQRDAEAVQGLEMFAQLFDRMRLAATDPAWQPPEGSFWEEMFTPPSVIAKQPPFRTVRKRLPLS